LCVDLLQLTKKRVTRQLTIINKKLKLAMIYCASRQFSIYFNSIIIVLSLSHFLFYLCFRGRIVFSTGHECLLGIEWGYFGNCVCKCTIKERI